MESPFAPDSATLLPQVEDPAVPPAVVWAELEQLLVSPSLRDAELLKRFLRYIVEKTLAGEGDRLKEYRLGLEVLERDPSFDPRLDPIVRMTARRLRAKLREHYENGGRDARLRIEVPKGGYAAAFVPVAQFHGSTAQDVGPALTPAVLAKRSERQRTWKLAATVALVAALAAAALYLLYARLSESGSHPPSLVVLPFLNLTGNPDNDYLSDGITDEITGEVAKAAGLRVVARTSAFQFKGKSEDVREIGKRLNASSVLEGSVQTQNDRLRITAQLIRASDGYHLWAGTYELASKDTFAVEDEISRALSRALSVRLSAQAESNAREHRVDSVAHELYLRGQYMRQRFALDDVNKAMTYFNQALDRDPLYAEAYAAMAAGYAVQGANAWAPAKEVYPKARAAAERAIELDPNLPDAHAILANIRFFYDWDFPAAEKGFKRAIELNPNSSAAHHWYGILLYYSRRFDEARAQFNLAKEVNPLAVQIDLAMVLQALAERKYDDAIALDRKVVSENNNAMGHMLLAFAYINKKQYKKAIEEGQTGVAMAGNDGDTNLALANLYVQAGEREKALAIMNKFLDDRAVFIPPFTVAAAYAELAKDDLRSGERSQYLADKEQMYHWLDKSIEQRSPAVLKLDIVESFDPYRSEPRFQEVIRKTGLMTR